MKFLRWFRREHPGKNETRDLIPDFLATYERFRTLMEAERLRADRGNTEFATVVFRFPDREIHATKLSRFAEALEVRLRATDHAGFCADDSKDIGVILWEGSAMAVSVFLNSLDDLLGNSGLPVYDVYLYPAHPQTTAFRRLGFAKQKNLIRSVNSQPATSEPFSQYTV